MGLRSRSHRTRALTAGVWVPPLAVVALIVTLGVNVPFQDDWDVVSAVSAWRAGTLTFDELWHQHSEHRIPTVKLVVSAVGNATDYNLVAEMIVGFMSSVVTLLILWRLVTLALEDEAPDVIQPIMTAISLLLFSMVLHENWFWGLASIEHGLMNVTAIGVIWALTTWPHSMNAFALAMMATVGATFTTASGTALWLTGGLAIWLAQSDVRRWTTRLTIWIGAAGLTAAAYVRGLEWANSSFTGAIDNVDRILAFASACVGVPFAYGTSPQVSAVCGAAGISALVCATRVIHKTRPALMRRLVPVFLVAAHGLAVVVIIAVGRSQQDSTSAMISHYAFGPTLVWIATVVVCVVATSSTATQTSRGQRTASMAIVLLLLIAYTNAYAEGFKASYVQSRNLAMAADTLLWEGPLPASVSRFLYKPDQVRLDRQVATLQSARLGPFAAAQVRAPRHSAFRPHLAGEHADGVIDGGDCQQIQGWAWDPAQPNVPVSVDLWYRRTRLGTVTANWFRPDLLKAGIGNGQHGFVFVLQTPIDVGRGRKIEATLAGSGVPLKQSPKAVMCQVPTF